MKLNVDIIFDNLKSKYSCEKLGFNYIDSIYDAPELYLDSTKNFEDNKLYITTAEYLPIRPNIGKNVMIICVGDSIRLNFYKEHAAVILIRQKFSFLDIFQYITSIFKIYNDWESQILWQILDSISLKDILNVSSQVIKCPIHILEYANKDNSSVISTVDVSDLNFREMLIDQSLNTKTLVPDHAYYIEYDQHNILCTYIRNSRGEFLSCIYFVLNSEFGLNSVLCFSLTLAEILSRFYEINPAISNEYRDIFKDIITAVLTKNPLNGSQKIWLNANNQKKIYYCISIHKKSVVNDIQFNHIAAEIKKAIPNTLIIEFNGTILAFVSENNIPAKNKPQEYLRSKLNDILTLNGLHCGISNGFRDLQRAYIYYQQAESSIENGLLTDPDSCVYFFREYALIELIANCTGIFPIESYYPQGMYAILRHDELNSTSYFETLKVFLEESMSYSKAARRLFIHRSTLIERIERIKELIRVDFDNPNEVLQLWFIIKAIEVNKLIKH